MEKFEILGNIVWKIREEKGMSKKDLGSQIGYSYSQISRLERGKIKNPAYMMILQIENVFHVSMKDEIKKFEEN